MTARRCSIAPRVGPVVIGIGIGLSAAAGSGVARAAPNAADEAGDRGTMLQSVSVGGDGVDADALLPELRLRRPDLAFERGAGRPSGEQSRLSIDRTAQGLHLELTTPDARTYARDVPADDDIGPRAVAADVVAFLGAVERGAVPPQPTQRSGRRSKAASATEPSLASRLAEALQLGAGLGPSVTVPLARAPDARAGAFVAGNLTLRAQTVHGVLFEFGTRVGGKRADGHRLVRGRLGFGAGYRWTRGAFDLPLTAALTVEPWSIRTRTSNGATLDSEVARLQHPPAMVGLALRASPAALLPARDGITIRIGGSLEMATSAVPGAGGGAVTVYPRGATDPAFRVGGFEASFLAQIGVWVPWKAIRSKRRSPL